MPRVTLYADKYIESDAANFINGKTRERQLYDKDVAKEIGLKGPAYSLRKKDGKFDFNYMELVKMIRKLELTDKEILALMKGQVKT